MSNSTIIAFTVYLCLVVLVALIAYVLTRNLSDFVLGGRRLQGPIAALSAGASDMSAWLLLGLPGAAFVHGLNQIWLPIGLTLGCYISWRLIAKPLRVFSEYASDSITLPSFLDNRFKDSSGTIRIALAIATLFFFAVYTSSGLVGGAILLERFGLDFNTGLLLGTSIIVAYTFIGGFLAVSWTDFFQGTFMFCCLLAVPYIATTNMGGLEPTIAAINAQNPFVFNPFGEELNLFLFVNLMAWGLGYFGQPHILVRFMSVTSTKEIPIARRIAISWMSLSMLGALLTGVVGNAYFQRTEINPESVFILFSQQLFSPWLSGILFAAILSSIMCAIDSQMLASSSALTEDIYHKRFRKKASQKELVWVGRIAIIVIAMVAILIASNAKSSVIDLVSFAWAGLGAAFGPCVILGLFWRRMTRNGAVAGVFVGALTVIIWKLLKIQVSGIFELYEILPAFVLGMLTIIIVSLKDKAPSNEVLAQFDGAWEKIKASK